MRKQERTLQQIDPLAAGTSWDVSIIFGLGAWSYALIVSVSSFEHVRHPSLMVVALALLTAAVAVHLWAAAPRHAPYTRLSFSFVVFLAISAAALQVASDDSGAISLFTEWGPISVALLFASASGYRPLPDQYFAGLFAVVTLAVILGFDGLDHTLALGLPYFVVSGLSMLTIVVLGQAAYTYKATRIWMSWQKAAKEAPVPSRHVSLSEIAGPMTLEAKEFLISMLRSGRVGAHETSRARELAQSVRSQLVSLSDQTWVERAGCELHDPEGVFSTLDLSAQAAISALITGLRDSGVQNLQLSFRTDPVTARLSCVVQGSEIKNDVSAVKFRSQMSSYLRVMYVVFNDVRLINNHGQVNVMFYYAK
jgi:hypothetical protein